MASPLAKKMAAKPAWLQHIEDQDSTGIQDATIPLAANSMMLGTSAGVPVASFVNTLKSLLALPQAQTPGDYLGIATNLASPFSGSIQGGIKGMLAKKFGVNLTPFADFTRTTR